MAVLSDTLARTRLRTAVRRKSCSILPGQPAAYLERMELDDPEAYRSEVLGEFRAGLSTFIDPQSLAECVEEGVRERAPTEGVQYRSFIDAASGSGKDSFALGIAHKDGERGVLDVCQAWRPPFNPSGVIAEAADTLKAYGIQETTGDRYAPGFVAEGFRSHGIKYNPCDRDTSSTYLELLPLVNSKAAVILDQAGLLRELREGYALFLPVRRRKPRPILLYVYSASGGAGPSHVNRGRLSVSTNTRGSG